MWLFPVDSREILLLGRQNPALTPFQSLTIEWFIGKTGMVHAKTDIFSSCFSVLVIYLDFILRRKQRQTAFLVLRHSSVTELFLFLMSACDFPTAAVGLWRSGGLEGRSLGDQAEGVGSSSQLAPEWGEVVIRYMG